jgi:hypothetical protein
LETTTPADEMNRRRLAQYAEVLDQAAQLATDFSPDDLTRWYSVWGRRFLAELRRGQAATGSSGSAGDVAQQHRAALDQATERHAELVAQLKVEQMWQRLQAEARRSDATSVWADALPLLGEVQSVGSAGAVAKLPVSIHAPSTIPSRLRWVVALGVVLAGLALQVWPRDLRVVAPRWPMLAGVLLGLTWWLWLEPSLLGWAIVGLSLLLIALLR